MREAAHRACACTPHLARKVPGAWPPRLHALPARPDQPGGARLFLPWYVFICCYLRCLLLAAECCSVENGVFCLHWLNDGRSMLSLQGVSRKQAGLPAMGCVPADWHGAGACRPSVRVGSAAGCRREGSSAPEGYAVVSVLNVTRELRAAQGLPAARRRASA